jgi:hypothetical protein
LGRPKRKVLTKSYAKIQSQVVAKGKKVRKVTNESKKLFVKRWENYLSAKPKKLANAFNDGPCHNTKLKHCNQNKGCCTKPCSYPQEMKKSHLGHEPK